MATNSSFLGRGWSFPPEFSKPQGLPSAVGAMMVEGVVDIEQSIRILLSTTPGERVMEPDFGCSIADFLFRKIDASNQALIESRVRAALMNYEPRIKVENVTVDVSSWQAGRLDICIFYSIRSTNSRHNMVYPYCLEEGTLLNLP